MKEKKKIKTEKLNFYTIDDNYIRFLSKFDKHIAYNKNEKRPYVGVVIILKEHYYFAPLFSPKKKHKTYKDNLSFFKIVNKSTRKSLGIIRFSDMIPVPNNSIYPLDIENISYGYKRLISEQYSYINITENKHKIMHKAEKIYNIVNSNSNNKMARFYKELSCNYKLLEEKSLEYKYEHD